MASTEIKRYILRLNSIYRGNPWYGNAITRQLARADERLVFSRPVSGAHSMAEILAHLIAWRQLLARRLQGDASYVVRQKESFDWRRIDPHPETAWNTLLHVLDKSQKDILNGLENQDDGLLNKQVAGRRYTYRKLLEGILEHDIYHLGQIALLIKNRTHDPPDTFPVTDALPKGPGTANRRH